MQREAVGCRAVLTTELL